MAGSLDKDIGCSHAAGSLEIPQRPPRGLAPGSLEKLGIAWRIMDGRLVGANLDHLHAGVLGTNLLISQDQTDVVCLDVDGLDHNAAGLLDLEFVGHWLCSVM